MSYLIKRGKWFHFRRWIPEDFQNLYKGRKFIWVSLKTDSEAIALQRANQLNAELEDIWSQALFEDNFDVESKFKQAVRHARINGFRYKSTKDISNDDLVSLVARIMKMKSISGPEQFDVEALLGSPDKPSYPISKALTEFFEFEKPNLQKKSGDQLRKWENPRKKAITNFIEVVGDKDVTNISRDDTLAFRSWWHTRIKIDHLTTNSANKDFSYVKQVLAYAIDDKRLTIDLNGLFDRMRFTEERNSRSPFPASFIREEILNVNNLNGLNLEAQLLLYAMADTGARILELVGLNSKTGDICLDTDIPYIHIRPSTDRQLKTPQSERIIPLTGAALFAFKQLPNGFERYYCKADLISATTNKYLRDHNLLPTDNHSVYSLRHSFEDRLTAVEPPDKVQAALMGHKYSRPRYGKGPTLEQKKKWLDLICFDIK